MKSSCSATCFTFTSILPVPCRYGKTTPEISHVLMYLVSRGMTVFITDSFPGYLSSSSEDRGAISLGVKGRFIFCFGSRARAGVVIVILKMCFFFSLSTSPRMQSTSYTWACVTSLCHTMRTVAWEAWEGGIFIF